MYLKHNGTKVKTLVLSGGGASVFSMYLGLFKHIDTSSLDFDLIVCSAGAFWFAECLCQTIQSKSDNDERVKRVKEMQKEVLDVDLLSILESEYETMVNDSHISEMKNIYSCVQNVRIKDLRQLCNGRLVRFAVCEMKEDTLSYEPIIVDETNSPDTLLFDVILASCSVPVIFPKVSLSINNTVTQCLDGDMADYSVLFPDDDYIVITPRYMAYAMTFYNKYQTNIPIIDNLLRLVSSAVMRFANKKWRGHSLVHDCEADMHTPMWDEELYKVGERFFEDNLSLEELKTKIPVI